VYSRVAAQQREGHAHRQLIPQFLQTTRGVKVPLLREDVHHLAINPQTISPLDERFHQFPDRTMKEHGIWPPIAHERRQRLLSIQHRQDTVAPRLATEHRSARNVRMVAFQWSGRATTKSGIRRRKPGLKNVATPVASDLVVSKNWTM
jgi:hypothetical protein